MRRKTARELLTGAASLALVGCAVEHEAAKHLIDDPYADEQAEIREAVLSIKADIEAGNIEGLQAIHLDSDKFTKFGPRSFERQDVASTNESEAAFFGAISDARYETRDLKIDVFGDVGIATYYPEVRFVRDGNVIEVSGRQTLVFLRTDSGWRLVHEHGTVKRP